MTVELGYVAQIAAGRMEQGRLTEVIDALAGLDRLDFDLPGWRAMLAGALAEAGRFAQASDELDKCAAQLSAGEAETRIEHAPLVIRHLAEVCRRLGQTDRAAEMLPFVRPWASQMSLSGGLSIEGASDRALGHLLATLGRLDDADRGLHRSGRAGTLRRIPAARCPNPLLARSSAPRTRCER